VDRLGDYLLSQADRGATDAQRKQLERWCGQLALKSAYHKQLDRQVLKKSSPSQACPDLLFGESAAQRFEVVENGVRYWLSFAEGYSVGLFLDQRDNRRRLLTGEVARQFPLVGRAARAARAAHQGITADASSPTGPLTGLAVLNTFAYTCSFSVCAALAGATTVSLDLSRKYLDWGRDNFRLNGLDPDRHDFIYGDCFNWMKRLAKKGRQFGLVVVDPPTFSHSKQSGLFRAEADYGRLVALALALLSPGGVLLACTNTARLRPDDFLAGVRSAVAQSGRRIEADHFAPQPTDFPTSRDEPAYLKVAWMRIG
jgi:23S rRNA (cytosine1962-C5)-methyltransferase